MLLISNSTMFHCLEQTNLLAFANAKNVNDLRFDRRTQRIVQCSFWDKISYLIPCFSFARTREKDLNKVVTSLIRKIELLSTIQSGSVEDNTKSNELNLTIRALFFNKIAKLKNNPFQSNLDKNAQKFLLSKEIQNILSPELSNFRKLRSETKKVSSGKSNEAFRLKKKIAKAKLAIQLGVGVKENAGTTGSVCLFSINGKPLGIFKASLEHASWSIKIKHYIKRWTYGQSRHLSAHPAAQAKTEVIAAKLDRKCGFNLTPYSDFVEIAGKNGAFLEFLDGYKEAKEILTEFGKKETYSPEEIDLFQKMTIYDYLIGNLDRHEENWFVKYNQNGSKAITELRCIDNSNSFIKSNPTIKFLMKNQYKWKNEKIAQIPFSDTTKAFIKENVTFYKIKQFIADVKADLKLNDLLEPEMLDNLKKRLEILQKLPQLSFPHTPEQLGQLTTDHDINSCLYGA